MVDNIGQTPTAEQAKTFFEALAKKAQASVTAPATPKWQNALMLAGIVLVPVTIIVFAYLMSRR
jgi:hypothetical protein